MLLGLPGFIIGICNHSSPEGGFVEILSSATALLELVESANGHSYES